MGNLFLDDPKTEYFKSVNLQLFIEKLLRYKYNLNNYQDHPDSQATIFHDTAEVTKSNILSIYTVEQSSKGTFSDAVRHVIFRLRLFNYKLPRAALADFCKEFDPFTNYIDSTSPKHTVSEDYAHLEFIVEDFLDRYDVSYKEEYSKGR